MAALLVALAVMSLMLSMALPVWHHAAQREREAELIFRGEQYARAIMLYQRQTPGAYSPAVEGRFLRRAYRDPLTAAGEFRLIRQSELAEFSGLGATGGAADDGEPTEARDGPRRQRQGEDVRNRPGFMQGVRPSSKYDSQTGVKESAWKMPACLGRNALTLGALPKIDARLTHIEGAKRERAHLLGRDLDRRACSAVRGGGSTTRSASPTVPRTVRSRTACRSRTDSTSR